MIKCSNLHYVAVLFCLCLPIGLQAQESGKTGIIEHNYDFWNLHAGDSSFVFAPKAYLRSEPHLNAAIVDSLATGAKVIVQNLYHPLTVVNGLRTPWVHVSYEQLGQIKQAFVWQGLLSINAQKTKDGLLFMNGIKQSATKTTTYGEQAYYVLALKVLDSTKIIASKDWQHDYGEQSYIEGRLFGNLGLSNCSNIYRLGIMGEACGIASVFYYFSFHNNQLFSLPGKQLVGDAGMYYYEETLLFPSEHKGAANIIIKKTEEGVNEEDDYDKNGDPIFKIKKSSQKFQWNGSKYHKI